jgi:hypothetical protein
MLNPPHNGGRRDLVTGGDLLEQVGIVAKDADAHLKENEALREIIGRLQSDLHAAHLKLSAGCNCDSLSQQVAKLTAENARLKELLIPAQPADNSGELEDLEAALAAVEAVKLKIEKLKN